MNNTVFLFPQLQHDLIPQAHSPEEDEGLAREMKALWVSMFQLFQQKTDEIIADYPNKENQDKLYLKVRQALDECSEVKAVHHRRGMLQDRLWARVLIGIAADRQRLEDVYRCHRAGTGGLTLNPDLDIPSHQLKTNIHRMPGGVSSRS
jgi:hypothetical protein